MKKLPLALILAFSACASLPPFQKTAESSGQPGYWSRALESDGSFMEVFVRLDKSVDMYRYQRRYMIVAAANVCLEKGFAYSDTLSSSLSKLEGTWETKRSVVHCMSEKSSGILGVELDPTPLADGNAFLIASLSPPPFGTKKNSKLAVGDVITHISGERVRDMAQLQYQVTKVGHKKEKTIALDIVRNGQKLKLMEELFYTDYFANDNKKLAHLRNF